MNCNTSTIVAVDRMNPCEDVIEKAVLALKEDSLVVAPTDTCYGLLARADSESAIEKVVNLKGRKASQPISLFVKDIAEAVRLAKFSETALAIAGAFLPGPLTLVLPSRVDWPSPLVVDGKIGVRIPDSPLIMAIAGRLNTPLTATSANRSGEADVATVQELYAEFSDSVSLYLDGGPLKSPASTVVEIVDDNIRIIREGHLTRSALVGGLKEGRLL